MKVRRFLLLSIILAVTATAQASTWRGSTTLGVRATSDVVWNQEVAYDWQVKTIAAQSSYTMTPDLATNAEFNVQILRTISNRRDIEKVSGKICVRNEGEAWTRDLRIYGTLQQKKGDTFIDVPGVEYKIDPRDEIGPGDRRCFHYGFDSPVLKSDSEYRAHASVCISNLYDEFSRRKQCVTAKAALIVPATPLVTEVDKIVSLADVLTCPSGFNCEFPSIDQSFDQNYYNIPLSVWVSQKSPTCAPGQLTNKIVATPLTTGVAQVDSVSAELRCPAPTPTPTPTPTSTPTPVPTPTVSPTPTPGPTPTPPNCTFTPDYWKLHPDQFGAFLPLNLGVCGGTTVVLKDVATATTILGQSYCANDPANGIGELYAQLLAALLSSASGADVVAINDILTAANSFLVRQDCSDWALLSAAEKSTVLGRGVDA